MNIGIVKPVLSGHLKGNGVNESDPRSNVHYLSSSDLFGTNIRLASSDGRALHRYHRGH